MNLRKSSNVMFTALLSWFLLPALLVNSEVANLDEPFSSSFSQLEHAACVTLFHRNGRTGCGTADRSVDVGHLVYFNNALPDTQENYVVVIEEYDLTAQTINTLSAAKGGLLQGILVLNSTSYSGSSSSSSSQNSVVSPDSQTPRGYGTPSENLNYGYYSYPWNSKGENLFSYDLFGVSMAYVSDSDVSDSLRQEAQTADSNVVAEFNYYMGPENMNSVECLAWKDASNDEWSPKCLPLGGNSVWASAGSPPAPSSANNNENQNSNNNNNNKKPVFILAAGMDSTSMFHDLSPGANTAASNILTILMAAKLIGDNVNDGILDGLPNRIVFALFQGETYGFVGSRAFLRDVAYPGFQCNDTARVRSSTKLGDDSDYGCLNPLRPSLRFADLGQIAGMLSVDQVGHAAADGLLYVHADQDNDEYGTYLTNVLKYSSTNDFSVAQSNAGNNNGAFPYPPSPLTSLLQLSGGGVGGAVLSGYDYAFTNKVPYHSHKDSASQFSIELDTIAAAATIMARTALAVAYDDGTYSGNGDYQSPTDYAKNLIPQLSDSDEMLVELSNCLFYDGQCDLVRKYSSTEIANEKARTGLDLREGDVFGKPPNYYVSIYNSQPFAHVGGIDYGAYDGDSYGKKNTDAISMIPGQLESTIYGLFNDFLGRSSVQNGGTDQSCKKSSDCANVEYCAASGDSATCTGGGLCVCKRAHYHIALDEALQAAENKPMGYYVVNENDQGISAMYTEPYWSPYVGVRVYRDVGALPGAISLAVGLSVGAASLFGALVLKISLKKQKLY